MCLHFNLNAVSRWVLSGISQWGILFQQKSFSIAGPVYRSSLFQLNLFLIAGPVNSSTLPTLNLAKAVSVLTSLSNKEKAKVKKALETSSVQFAQMEDTFNKKRFKRKWVQSTVESSRLGQNTRMIDNLVATANKSKIIHTWKAFWFIVLQHWPRWAEIKKTTFNCWRAPFTASWLTSGS